MNAALRRKLCRFQRNEITEYHIYRRLARTLRDEQNREVLLRIAEDEHRHYTVWRKYTGTDVAPNRWKIRWHYWVSRLLGVTFGIKLMEHGEDAANETYADLKDVLEEAEAVSEDENRHEDELIALLDEERLRYTGSIVLGLNDALVELTGALAGYTLALRNTELIAMTGLITGIAAALSMAASEYLSTKSEDTTKSPVKASIYTGLAYVGTVAVLIAPYLFLANYFVCLGLALLSAVIIIFVFNYYIAVARDLDFRRRFLEMAGLSLGVAVFSFGVGFVMRHFLGVEG